MKQSETQAPRIIDPETGGSCLVLSVWHTPHGKRLASVREDPIDGKWKGGAHRPYCIDITRHTLA